MTTDDLVAAEQRRGRPCPCRLCGGAARSGWDAGDRKLVADVEGHGWHVVRVTAVRTPEWAYSIGLWHTMGVPEVVVFGMDPMNMHRCVNNLGDAFRAGSAVTLDVDRDDVFEDSPARLRPVDPSWHPELFGYGRWLYGEFPPVVQLVWPDRHDRFPWDPGFEDEFRDRQPDLSRPLPAWWPRVDDEPVPPHAAWPGSHATTCFTLPELVDGSAPVHGVFHDHDDGDWSLVPGHPYDDDAVVAVHLHHLLDLDPSLLELHDLPSGWHAWRRSPDQPWQREPIQD